MKCYLKTPEGYVKAVSRKVTFTLDPKKARQWPYADAIQVAKELTKQELEVDVVAMREKVVVSSAALRSFVRFERTTP